jgi:DNA modification methylase
MMKQETDLFGEAIKMPYEIEVTPVSVIDLKPQGVREKGNHDRSSSREEYSPFPQEIASLCFEYFMRDASLVFDPFAGWGERGQAANSHGKNYIGFDLSPDAITKAKEKGVDNILADSMTAEIPTHDGLVTCPPYWNLEVYNGKGIDKASNWSDFCDQYKSILSRCWSKAVSGSTYCIMVGEWRSNHKFHDLEGVTRRIMQDLGAEMFDQIIVSRKTTSKIKIMLPQAKRLGYTVRVHESLIVYKKP